MRYKDTFMLTENLSLAREILNEGTVLLKNDNSALPLKEKDTIAVFGLAQCFKGGDTNEKGYRGYLTSGGGSGTPTPAKMPVGPLEALRAAAKNGRFGLYLPLADAYDADDAYMPSAEMMDDAAAAAGKALYFISRYTCEGVDRHAGSGDWLLSDEETTMLRELSRRFKQVIVLANVSGPMDTTWAVGKVPDIRVDALVMIWYGGNEAGNSMVDILTGDVNPSGKLVDTFAADINDYPSTEGFDGNRAFVDYTEDIFVGYRYFSTFDPQGDKVRFPFGFGLSYTTFALSGGTMTAADGNITVRVTVTNTGAVAGKEVVQAYFSAPQGVMGKAARELAGFVKTGLLAPGESEQVTIIWPIKDMACYDDTGKTGHPSAYVLEQGVYTVYMGRHAADMDAVGTYKVPELTVVQQLTARCVPVALEKRLLSDGSYETLPYGMESSARKIPAPTEPESDPAARRITVQDEKNGKATLEQLTASMTTEELILLTVGYPPIVDGATGTIGGDAKTDAAIGLHVCDTSDGPAGLRLPGKATAFPSQMLICCTWNPDLANRFGTAMGAECLIAGVDIWLAPGLNIHRNPLCGRNFEYLSEDPLLNGKMAVAICKGVQEKGVALTIKHFACNDKEANRDASDSRVSERALREIYLRAFAMAVKEGHPYCIMSAYNSLNGVDTSENYDLLMGIARGEWGFDGLIMSDWGNNSDIVRELQAGNNVKMPEGNLEEVRQAYREGAISRRLLEENARYILGVLMNLPKNR